MISPSAVCVVLSGGNLVGLLAHIGALQQLERLGFRIKAAGGTSAGAIAAALLASYRTLPLDHPRMQHLRPLEVWTLEAVGRVLPQLEVEAGAILEEGSLFASRAMSAELARYLPRWSSDLELPLRVVTSNLSLRQPHIWDSTDARRWPLRDAVQASSALWPIFPPVEIGGDTHIDGGLVRNLAAGLWRDRPEKTLCLRVRQRGEEARRLIPPGIGGVDELAAAAIDTLVTGNELAALEANPDAEVIDVWVPDGPALDPEMSPRDQRIVLEGGGKCVLQWWGRKRMEKLEER